MNKKLKKALSVFLAILMLLSSAPLEGIAELNLWWPSLFTTKAEAVNTTYNATAAAEYAKQYALNYNKEWYFYVNGGDCANFVSQSLFMGGMPMTSSWHSYDGNIFAYLMRTDYVWIRCHDLMYYLISIGGDRIDNPIDSDFEIGDAVFYDWDRNGKIDHSAIVTDIVNGVPKVSCHSTPEQASKLNAHWTLGRNSNVVTLVKLHGEKCTKNSSPNYDYYRVTTATGCYTTPGGRYVGDVKGRYTVRVTETMTYNGATWGKFNFKGTWAWLQLSSKAVYVGHRNRIQVNHLFGGWYTIREANCLQKGIERRDCQRCGYYETREFGLGAHVPGAEATCTTAQVCTVCGVTLTPALGHDMTDWVHHEDGTCQKKATEIRVCLRANDKTEIREKDYGNHKFSATLDNPTCVDDGAAILKCEYCDLTKVDETKDQWTTTWATADSSTIDSLDENLYESRNEYRYRTKKTTTSSSSSLDGWTSNGWHWSDYGSWSGWSTNYVSGSDSREVETQTTSYLWGYHMDCYNTKSTSGGRQFRNYSVNGNYSAYGLNGNYGEYHWEGDWTVSDVNSAQTVSAGSYTSSGSFPGTNKSSVTGYLLYDGVNTLLMFNSYEIWKDQTEYRYRDRSKVYDYYKWGEWSEWSDGEPNSSLNLSLKLFGELETRTTYRFKLGALGHNDITKTLYATCAEDGYVKNVCQRCGRELLVSTTAKTGHNMQDDWYSWTDENGVELERRDCHNTDKNTNTPCTYYETRSKEDEHIHVMEEFERTEPKCIVDGKIVYKCTDDDCDYITEESIPALGHDMGDYYETRKATCTQKGELRSDCQRSGCDHYVTKETEMVAHTPVTDEAVAAHCTKDGLTEGSHCSMCGKVIEEQKTVTAPGHEWGKWITIAPKDVDGNETTCGEWKKYRECTRECGCEYCDGYEEEIWFVDHNYLGPVVVKLGCVTPGYEYYTCTNCGDVQMGDLSAPLGHDWGEYVSVCKPTCTEEGLDERECNRCHITDEKITPAYGHATSPLDTAYNDSDDKMELISSAKNTCGNGTIDTYQCTHIDENTKNRCTYKVVIGEIKDHNLGDYVTVKEPTCTEPGYKHKECQNDGCTYATADEPILPLGHDITTTVTKEPTCLEKGNRHTECSRGDVCYDEEIDATGHLWQAKKVVDPTCVDQGYIYYVCMYDKSHTQNGNLVNAIGHDYGSWVDDENGTTHTKTCQREGCNDTVSEHKISANHKMSEIERVEAKCKENGYIKYKCDDCDYTYTDTTTLKATDHDWGEWEITTEPTYDSVGEKQQICKNDKSHKNKDIVPVLTRPSEDNENVTTDKTVDYDSLTGEAVIRLLASSNGKKITVNSRIPLDIVLVLDQSGSMKGQLNKKLKEAVESFNKSIYNDAVATGLDHRIAMVGFARGLVTDGRESYLNTGILTTGSKYIKYGSLSNEAYKNALVSVNADNSLNPILTTATENIKAEGATATDLGLDMACKIFSQYKEDESRKRIVVLMTDGVPTYKSDYMDETADNAKEKANIIKSTYEADIYSVGVLSGNEVNKAKTFLKEVASKDDSNAPLYYDCSESSELISSFSKIAKESVTVKTDFTDVTLVDTVSKAFTLTSKQEQKLRADAIEKLGVSNSDITVTRYADGTTEVKIQHISPKKIESGNDVKFVIDFSFSVTANENALIADSYVTNTDNAGVIVGVKDVYENNFTAPSDNVEEADGVVYFNINGITYHILRVHAGDKVEQPEINLEGGYTFSGWDIPDEITFDGGKYTIDATLTQDEYTVTWIIDGKTTTENYHFGDIITIPKVKENANGDAFDSWDKEVPTTMPAEDLTFTASYSKHEHKWVTSTTTSGKDVTAFSNVYCELCGESPDKTLSYTLTGTFGNIEYTYDLKLVDAKNIKVNVDGSITVSLPIPESMKYAKQVKIYREEADGTLTDLNGTKNRSGSYITFTTDHFSKYILKAIYECDESGKHVDKNCDKNCDICGVEYPELGHKYASLVIAPTCTEGGYTVHTCSACGNSYTDNKVSALGHNDSNGDGKCDNCGDTLQDIANNCNHLCHSTNGFVQFIWKIVRFFCKLFNTNKVCSCGVKHW